MQEAKTIARNLGMNEYELQHFTGNVIQHQLHGEIVTIINEAGVLKNAVTGKALSADEVGRLIGEMGTYVGEFADIACGYNKLPQHVEKAWTVTDVCWGLLDCTYAAVQGVGDGIGNTLSHLKDLATDPIGSAKRYAESAGNLALGILRALYEVESLHTAFELSPELGEQKARDIAKNIEAMCTALYAEIKDLPPRDVVRGVAAIVTESYLGNRVRTVTHKFLNTAKEKAVGFAQKIGEKLTNKSPILTTPEGMQVRIADKMTKYHHQCSARKNTDRSKKDAIISSKITPIYTYKNGKYNGVKYHHANSKGTQSAGQSRKGIKNPAPVDGQAALDNSVQVKDKGHFDRRVGISNGEIVVLDGSIQQGYHAHVRTWDDIITDKAAEDIKKALLKNKLVDGKGNIL